MSQSIFKPTPLSERSFLQELFKQHPQENAVKEVNNLLATQPLLQIQKQQVKAFGDKYKVNIEKEFKLNLEEFYAVYLNHCLIDKSLSDDELKELKHLKHILHLDDKSINKLHAKIGGIVYQQTFDEAVADGRLSNDEKTFLDKLENELQLPKELAAKISAETRARYMKNYVAQVVADQRMSPDEEKEMQAIAASLDIELQIDKENRAALDKLKQYWALENLDLETVKTEISLQKAEQCYMVLPNIEWHELRTVRQKINYSGYATNFRVAKGFYLRSGSFNRSGYSTEEIKPVDKGTLYLTNKRIIFTGAKKNATIQLSKILGIAPHENGVEIDKETGKSPVFNIPEGPDVFCIVLERLLRERSA